MKFCCIGRCETSRHRTATREYMKTWINLQTFACYRTGCHAIETSWGTGS